jgi:hypothetical protein
MNFTVNKNEEPTVTNRIVVITLYIKIINPVTSG